MNNETMKLVNVLRRIARAAGYAAWVNPMRRRRGSVQHNTTGCSFV